MATLELKLGGRVVRPRRAVTAPDFSSETVLVSDPWEYVDLWLNREGLATARAHWNQAREFARAAATMAFVSAPLPAYYCFLNAVKTLLAVRDEGAGASHGVTGDADADRRSLESEEIHFKSGGILAALCRVMNEASGDATYNLKDALYNLPFVHRAYCLTYTSAQELFLPIKDPRFVRKTGSTEAWFCATLESRYASAHTIGKLPSQWEKDGGCSEPGAIRKKSRFKWDSRRPTSSANRERLQRYHASLRNEVVYIFGPTRLWYLKRAPTASGWLDRSPLTLTFAIMHRLSELSRYDPSSLQAHAARRHNWLLSEFVELAPRQFIDEIASEITGFDFMVPGIRR